MDITKPITLESLGTNDDPCFGQHHDPRNGDCQRCGDNEFCALAMGQLTHMKRLEIEKQQKFKDMEEQKILPPVDKKVIRKSIKNRIREAIKLAGSVGISRDEIIQDIFASYSKDGFKKPTIGKILDRVSSNSDRIEISINTNKYLWKRK